VMVVAYVEAQQIEHPSVAKRKSFFFIQFFLATATQPFRW